MEGFSEVVGRTDWTPVMKNLIAFDLDVSCIWEFNIIASFWLANPILELLCALQLKQKILVSEFNQHLEFFE